MSDSAKELVRAFVARVDTLLHGGAADVWDLLSERAVVQVSGSTPLSGIYRGQQEIVDLLARSVARRVAAGSVTLLDAIGQGDQVGAFLQIRATTHAGRTYNQQGDPAGCYFRLAAGRISDIRLFPDTTQVETEIYGRRFVANARPAATPREAAHE